MCVFVAYALLYDITEKIRYLVCVMCTFLALDNCLHMCASVAYLNTQGEHSAILSTFIKLPFVNKIFVSSIFEWPFYPGFTVNRKYSCM